MKTKNLFAQTACAFFYWVQTAFALGEQEDPEQDEAPQETFEECPDGWGAFGEWDDWDEWEVEVV